MNALAGKVAVVTGGSRGIGKAVAEAFDRQGASVIAVARSWGCDVSRESDVEQLFAEVRRRFGRLDVLVNNAGILHPRKPMVQYSSREWDESIAVNLRSVFLCTRAALRIMIPQRSGLVINVSSGAGKRAAPFWGPYAVAKWGVEGFTKTVAEEVKEFGISVIALNPGGTRTRMRALAYPEEDPQTLKTPEELAEFFVAVATGKIRFQPGDSIDYAEQKR
jgi:NAD(P)-dependent dehydrogenase (short-subunit alcohol dehydrogenase family)